MNTGNGKTEQGSAVFYLLLLVIILILSGALITYFNSKKPAVYEIPNTQLPSTLDY